MLQPVLQGKSLALHPAVVLLAVTAGGSLYGIAGAFFAVPVAAVAAVVLRYLGEVLEDADRRADAGTAGRRASAAARPSPAGEVEPGQPVAACASSPSAGRARRRRAAVEPRPHRRDPPPVGAGEQGRERLAEVGARWTTAPAGAPSSGRRGRVQRGHRQPLDRAVGADEGRDEVRRRRAEDVGAAARTARAGRPRAAPRRGRRAAPPRRCRG